ncbi:MAG: EamA family transporter RarD [Hyphomicrobiales bacterium]
MPSDIPDAPSPSRLNPAQEGVACAMTAFFLWGLSAWFYKVIHYVPAYEVIAHRVVWSVPLAAAVLIVIGRTGDIGRAFRTPKILLTLMFTAALVSLNWLLYVWAVVGGYALEASLGYFINPLMSVLLGLVLLREKLLPAQAVAVGLAVVAVIIQTVLVGSFPWLALTLASTFATYGYLRKTIDIGPAQGFLVEILLVLPVVIAYLVWVHARGDAHFASDGFTTFWLILAGPMTALPLMLFATAARRIRLSTLGLLQYIAPSLIFVTAIFVFGEPMNLARFASFALIWIGLAIYSISAMREDRRQRERARLPG